MQHQKGNRIAGVLNFSAEAKFHNEAEEQSANQLHDPHRDSRTFVVYLTVRNAPSSAKFSLDITAIRNSLTKAQLPFHNAAATCANPKMVHSGFLELTQRQCKQAVDH